MTSTEAAAIAGVWRGMLSRCYNRKSTEFRHYGGRGIKVCSRWKRSLSLFISDMGPRPAGMSIDRIDNDGNYTPKNCRWASHQVQARNKRTNRILTINGQSRCVAEWAELSGVSQLLINSRIRAFWPPEKAVFHKPMTPREAGACGSNGQVRSLRATADSRVRRGRPPETVSYFVLVEALGVSYATAAVAIRELNIDRYANGGFSFRRSDIPKIRRWIRRHIRSVVN